MSLVLEVPLDRLRTSLAPLRGERTDRQSDLSAMPLRVAAADEGAFEVLDGFKRLSQWRAEGRREVPVVVEPVSGIARKARILAANSPRKTTSGMDEARVVASLAEEDGLSPTAISKLLGRKKTWVERRLLLARRLSPELCQRVDSGSLALSVAVTISSFGPSEQKRLADSVRRHALRPAPTQRPGRLAPRLHGRRDRTAVRRGGGGARGTRPRRLRGLHRCGATGARGPPAVPRGPHPSTGNPNPGGMS